MRKSYIVFLLMISINIFADVQKVEYYLQSMAYTYTDFGDFNGLNLLPLDSEKGVINLLQVGDVQSIKRTMFPGNTYYLLAAGDDSAVNIDIKLYDDKMNLITEDSSIKPYAQLEFTPDWAGLYHLEVILESGSDDGSHVGWLILFSED